MKSFVHNYRQTAPQTTENLSKLFAAAAFSANFISSVFSFTIYVVNFFFFSSSFSHEIIDFPLAFLFCFSPRASCSKLPRLKWLGKLVVSLINLAFFLLLLYLWHTKSLMKSQLNVRCKGKGRNGGKWHLRSPITVITAVKTCRCNKRESSLLLHSHDTITLTNSTQNLKGRRQKWKNDFSLHRLHLFTLRLHEQPAKIAY